jgi:hypothetical protein
MLHLFHFKEQYTSHKISSHGFTAGQKKNKMPKLVLVLDNAWFVLSRNVISQNKRCGVTKVYMQFVKFP